MERVRDIMTREVIWARSDQSIKEAYELMRAFAIRHLPVIDNENLIGLISEGDILLRSSIKSSGIHVPSKRVSETMSCNVVTCPAHMPISFAAATMMACKIDCLPVVQEKKLAGIVTTTDLLDLLCRYDEMDGHIVMPLEFSEPNKKPIMQITSLQ